MRRINVIIDEDVLEQARKITGKSDSETILDGLQRIIRSHETQQALKELSSIDFFEGKGVKELLRLRRDRKLTATRVAAKSVREPRPTKKRRVSGR